MEDRDKTNEELVEELDALRQEVDRLKIQETAHESQTELLRTLVSMGDRPNPPLILRSIAQQSLRICNRLTGAEEGSLFFLDDEGRVKECVLARGATIKERKESLIGRVLEKGLAGWVYEKHQVGLITDTVRDERWLPLPDQPFEVRSALCIPILRGKRLLGLITLTHPQPGYFRYEAARLMQTTTTQIGLIVDVLSNYTSATPEDNSIELAGAHGDVPTSAVQARSGETDSSRQSRRADRGDNSATQPRPADQPANPDPSADATDTADTADTANLASSASSDARGVPDRAARSTHSTDANPPPRSPLPATALPLPDIPTTQTPQSTLSGPPLSPSRLDDAHPSPPPKKYPPDPNSPALRDNELSRLGIYIVTWDGKFIYANHHFARTFGYRLNELPALSTIFSLVAEQHYDFVAEKIYQCVRGQIGYLSCRFRGKRKSGKFVNVEIYGVRTQFYGKAVTIGILRPLPKAAPRPGAAAPPTQPLPPT